MVTLKLLRSVKLLVVFKISHNWVFFLCGMLFLRKQIQSSKASQVWRDNFKSLKIGERDSAYLGQVSVLTQNQMNVQCAYNMTR